MAIESVNSAAGYQAQVARQTVQTVPVQKTAASDTEVAPKEKITVAESASAKTEDAAAQAQDTQNTQPTTNNEQLRKAVEQLNKNMAHSEAVFGFHEATNRVTIKIIDKDTKEVIKELPPEKTLDMIAKVWELAGMLVDEKR